MDSPAAPPPPGGSSGATSPVSAIAPGPVALAPSAGAAGAAPAPAAVPAAAAQAAAPPAVSDVPLSDPALYFNRELSWLEFNKRVLAQAEDAEQPLLERAKFLSIVATNLDEFFMIRVAALLRKERSGLHGPSNEGWSTGDQLAAIRQRAAEMQKQQAACWASAVRPGLADQGIRFLEPADYTPAVTEYLQGYFMREIWPVLTPLAFDPGHPFPYISNLSTSFAVVVKHGGRLKFARVKLPDVLPRFIPLPPKLAGHATTFVFQEDVVRANIQALFPGTTIRGAYLFRVIRDADLVIQEDEADDLLELVDESLRQRRHGALAMLQVEQSMPRRVLDILIENFEIEEANVFRTRERLGFGDWMQLYGLPRPDLKYAPFPPLHVWPPAEWEDVFTDLRHRDRLVHHPFQSFSAVETFLRAAVNDPHVLAIKMTLYRIGPNSPLIDLLVEAAEAGKQVAVLVELKARFDERNNIRWAHRLEAAGAHVVYGLLNLKTHAKVCLVVRQESDGIRRYAHLATGNYNGATSRIYTDIGLFTAKPSIVEDVSDLFNYLTGYSNQHAYHELLVAPSGLRTGLIQLIDHEAAVAMQGRPARIVMKINAITDHDMIRALYRASQAGVSIDLIVRGVCCLKPGVPGVSDRISVRSIVGRFLEHSRIFWFNNDGSPRVFIGSADLMERNLDRRVELLCPVGDAKMAEHLRGVVLGAQLRDTRRAWSLDADGKYTRVTPAAGEPPIDVQDLLLEWYAAEARAE
jgi:polyphosphate kinase